MVLIAPAASTQHDHLDDLKVRKAVLTVVTGLLREQPVHTMSLQAVSHAADVPLPRLRRLFPTRTDLLVTTVLDWHGRRVAAASSIAHLDGAAACLRAIVQATLAEPALSRALIGTITVSTTPDHPLALVVQREWRIFHDFVHRARMGDVAAGREPGAKHPKRGADQLLALYEGLQLQAMLRPEMPLLATYDRAVARLRAGWSTVYIEGS